MSFSDEYFALQNNTKKKKKKDEKKSFSEQYEELQANPVVNVFTGGVKKSIERTTTPLRVGKTALAGFGSEDIAPTVGRFSGGSRSSGKFGGDKEKEERKWFDKGAFDDGYDFGDVTKTILGTVTDTAENLGAGIIGMGEKLVDTAAQLGAWSYGGLTPNKYGGYNYSAEDRVKAKEDAMDFIAKDLYDEEKVAKKIISNPIRRLTGIDAEEDSVFGEKTDALAQSGGQLLATVGLQAVGVPWFVTTGVTSYGGELENAYKQGATFSEAGASAAISAGAEILTEKLSGGIKFGGKALDDLAVSRLSRAISNKTLRSMAKFGLDAVGEGSEEIISQVFSNLGSSLYKEEKLGELLASEEAVDEYIESFIGGAVLGGGSNVLNTVKSNKQGIDAVTGLTENEQAVVDKVYNDAVKEQEQDGKKLTQKEKDKLYEDVLNQMDKGYISTDTIEEVLGGETYRDYKTTVDYENALFEEYENLGNKQNATLSEQTRYNELLERKKNLEQNSQRNALKSKLSEEVFGLVQSDRLAESYNERGRKSQAFEADLTQYDSKSQETIKKAIDSGILNNTNRTHEFVDLIAKISADKGVPFDFTNNAKLKDSGFAVDGKQVNGFVHNGNITLNIDSAKALQTTVGHEVTHVLEGTELYDALSQSVIEYAKSKGDYQGRFDTLSKLYEGIEGANIDAELTADLVGDYLFSDTDFVKNLSVQNRNVFQKIWDEVKYLCKVATAGSKEARELAKVQKAFEDAYRAEGKGAEGTKYSLSDSEGVQLSPEQQEFFKDSKVRDKYGNLLTLYHGTQNDFTVFDIARSGENYDGWSELGEGIYLTPSKSEAKNYGDDAGWGREVKLMEVYADIKNPFNTNDPVEFDISDVCKKYKVSKVDEQFFKKSGYRLVSFLRRRNESVRDYLTSKGFDGVLETIDGEVHQVVAYAENQVKNTNNTKPTENPDIRFSLSEPVEKTKDLMALHNLRAEELIKSLDLGGLPMPSVAVIKAEAGHEDYGDVSLILPKETIDPQASRYNKIYGGDAWTPTYPKIEYKPSEAVAERISDKYYELAKKIGYDEVRPMYGYVNELEDALNRSRGEAAMLEKLYEDTGMMQVYLQDIGKEKVQPIIKETVTEISEVQAEMNQHIIDALGEDLIAEFGVPKGISPMTHRREFLVQHEAEIRDAYKRYFTEKHGFEEAEADSVVAHTELKELMKIMRDAYLYTQNNGVTVRTEQDYTATKEAIIKAASDGYRDWVDNLFKGVEEKSGIYNGSDYFTRSGNRKSWEALHWENTLENVVKAMRKQNQTGADALFAAHQIFATSAKDYGSIAEVKADSHRLRKISEEDYEAIKDSYTSRFAEIASRIMDKNTRNEFIAQDNAMECIVDAVRVSKTKAGIAKELKDYPQLTVTEKDVDDIVSLVADIADMPTGYFEAKPQRAVGFDEVGVFVIPNNADVKLKQELLNRGYAIAEYDPNIEGHRQQVVNQFEEYKFSLSNVGETPTRRRLSDIYGSDVKLQTAPVEAPVTVAENATVEPMFPDDMAPVVEDAERFDSLTDADAPPEMEAPYYESQPVTVDDPMEGRFPEDVGKRSVKAYMYENPEVKPFFQQEANAMLGELQNTTKGERGYADVDYMNDSGYVSHGIFYGTKRHTSDDIAYLLDKYHYTYDQIEKGLKAIIEDNGAENNAVSKRIEFILNDRLMDGYTDFYYGYDVPPNQDYINLINEKQITEYSKEAFEAFMANADEYAPPVAEEMDIAPVKEMPVKETPAEPVPLYENADGQQAMFEEPETPKRITRKELHSGIVDNIKARFAEKGLDFDKVLKKAKNLSTFATVDNTPQRVMEKALGYKEGQILSDITVNQVAQNETEGIKWLNSFTDRKNGLLAQLSKQYGIKPGSKESAAAQMYAEGFYVNETNDIIAYGDAELAKDFPDAQTQANIKGLASDPRIRLIYDDTLAMINESRTRNAYPEIPRLDNYFLHFRAMDDTFSKLGLPFNPNDIRAKDLPTDLNGVTADLKPGQPYFASAMHRTGKRTSFDMLGGLERYLTSAKNQIYHIDDIQTLRALRNYVADTYGQANGLEGLDVLSEEEAQDRIEKVYNSHLSTFAKFLNEEANVLAGKTALIDRGLEGILGRRGMTFLDTVNKQAGANMVGFNISSALTNFLPVAQTIAKTNKADFVKAFGQTVAHKVSRRSDGFTENSPVIIRRKGADRFYRTPWQKASDAGYVFMSAVDDISTELIARTKYNELTRKGMDSQQAHYETDKWVSRLIGDRSLGQMPQLYNSKALGLITKFQLEVRNQLDSQYYDTIQEAKVSNEHIENALIRNAKTAAKVTSTFVQLAVVQHLFGKAFESVAGYNPAFDIIDVIIKACGWDDDEDSEDTVLDNIEQGFLALLEDLPYTSTFTGGRIPIASVLPVEELVTGKDEWGNEKSRLKTLGEIAPYLLPGGYGQIKKTVQGLSMFSDDHPIAGSYTDSGKLRFPVEDTLGNRIQAGIFGQWASENARDYFDNERSPLNEKQIQEFIDVDIPIRDYWEYREGLSGLDKLAEKADYIAGLDLPIDKKNLLINNIADREEPIDLTGYEDFAGFEEFDFAVNNPEKYKIAQKVGGYEAYMKYQEGMKGMKLAEKADYIAGLDLTTAQKNALINGETDRKEPIDMTGYENYSSLEELDFAMKNPENYAVAKAVGGYEAYKGYSDDLYDIKADKDKNGKSISGSRKEKVLEYINNLDADYYTKLILWKSEYNSDDTYNYEIIEYLNGRDDISFEEEIIILRKLGFEVDSQGNISW